MAEPNNTPVDGPTPQSNSPILRPTFAATPPSFSLPSPLDGPSTPQQPKSPPRRLHILHVGDSFRFTHDVSATIATHCILVPVLKEQRPRGEFVKALREKAFGDFEAVLWVPGEEAGEMGRWDAELVDLLPAGVRVFVTGGREQVDGSYLQGKGIKYFNSSPPLGEDASEEEWRLAEERCLTALLPLLVEMELVPREDAEYLGAGTG